MENNIVLIIDGTNLLYRSHYAYPETLTDKNGNRTGAIFGTLKYLKAFVDEFHPVQIYVCTDVSRKTFRTDLYPPYKSNRNETDPALKHQKPLLEEFCKCAGIPLLKMDNYEADDLIGSMAKHAAEYEFKPYVISGDKDVFQLIDDVVTVKYVAQKGLVTMGKEQLAEKYFSLTPDQFIDLKAIMGDSSDNIPGIPNIGEKTGAKLLNTYGDLKGIYENIDKLKGKQKENLEANRDLAFLFQKLTTIVTDLPLDYYDYFEVKSKETYSFDSTAVNEFLDRLSVRFI